MLLFQSRFHEPLRRGEITLTFRTWPKNKVKVGGRYRCHPIGVLLVNAVDRVPLEGITDDEAKRSGFSSRDELVELLRGFGAEPGGEVFRVGLEYVGDGDRSDVALDADLSAADVEALAKKLEKMDARAEKAWVKETLAIIGKKPRTAASRLAKELGRETAPFKADVVKLKKLGLTQSFEVGYEVSPRGKAFLQKIGW